MKNIIMDCDTGQDDAIAIVLAIASKQFNIVGITTVGGNSKVENCTINTLKILELMGKTDIQVYQGEQKPLYKELKTLECVFGESGMAGADDLPFPKIKPVENVKAKDFIKDTFSKNNNVEICATAPLTNIAKAIMESPNICENIKNLTVIGGCPFPEPLRGERGNILINENGEKAEYNCWTDPEAFNIVLNSPIKNINLIGLNITRLVLYNFECERKLKEINSVLSNRIAKILSTVGEEDVIDYAKQRTFENDPVRAIHDVLAVVYMLDKSIFKSEILPLKVELKNENKKGQTIVENGGKLINIITDIDKNKFFDMFFSIIKEF